MQAPLSFKGVEAASACASLTSAIVRLEVLRQALGDVQLALEEGGLVTAKSHVGVACANLRRAESAVNVLIARRAMLDAICEERPARVETLTLADGRDCGLSVMSDEATELCCIGRWSARDGFRELQRMPEESLAVPSRDLAWDLANSAKAVATAEDDILAALLRRALEHRRWVGPGGIRWYTSARGADTILRIMRQGSPAPLLATSEPVAVERGWAHLLRELGWRPEPHRA